MDEDAAHVEKGRSSLGFRQLFPPFVQVREQRSGFGLFADCVCRVAAALFHSAVLPGRGGMPRRGPLCPPTRQPVSQPHTHTHTHTDRHTRRCGSPALTLVVNCIACSLLVVGLAPSHPLLAAQPPAGGGQLRLRFTEEALASQVSGKRKRTHTHTADGRKRMCGCMACRTCLSAGGGLSLKPETTICVCEVDSPSDADGTRQVLSYDIRACVNGGHAGRCTHVNALSGFSPASCDVLSWLWWVQAIWWRSTSGLSTTPCCCGTKGSAAHTQHLKINSDRHTRVAACMHPSMCTCLCVRVYVRQQEGEGWVAIIKASQVGECLHSFLHTQGRWIVCVVGALCAACDSAPGHVCRVPEATGGRHERVTRQTPEWTQRCVCTVHCTVTDA